MRGHGRTLRGLTPPQLADEVLGKRIEAIGRDAGPAWYPRAGLETDPRFLADALLAELHRARRRARVASVVIVAEALLLIINAGLRLLGS